MSKRKLLILATGYSDTPDSNEVFQQRHWTKVDDQSKPLPGVKASQKRTHGTSLIDLIIEEFEYGVEEHGRS
jgi:hypothetical protein